MIDSKLLLTVIILTYNHENSIAKTLQSVVEQETKYPYIVYIAEDCSTDGTLKICREYASKYPNKIKLFTNEKNMGVVKTFFNVRKKIQTPYWCILEGDDWWCDKDKIQKVIDIFKQYPKVTTVAHNTLWVDHQKGTEQKLNGEMTPIDKTGKVYPLFTFETAPYFHTSSRTHRNMGDKHNLVAYDLALMYEFLSLGSTYYMDEVMSVYNYSGTGTFSSISEREVELQNLNGYDDLNRRFHYKHNDYFIGLVNYRYKKRLKRLTQIFGKYLGWKIYKFGLKAYYK